MAEVTTIHEASPLSPEPVTETVVVKTVSPTTFWIVAGVLAVALGVAYFLLDNSVRQLRADVNTSLENATKNQKDATDKAIADIRSVLTSELAKMQESNKKLEAEKETIQVAVTGLRKEHDSLATTFQKVSVEHGKDIKDTSADLSETKQTLHKVDTKVGYLEGRVTKIEGKLLSLDSDITKLGEGSAALKAELKREQEELRKEVATVSKKGNLNEDDLRKLESKALAFELKVLNERAQQAAAAARQNDYKSALKALDFKD